MTHQGAIDELLCFGFIGTEQLFHPLAALFLITPFNERCRRRLHLLPKRHNFTTGRHDRDYTAHILRARAFIRFTLLLPRRLWAPVFANRQ